MRVRCGWVPTFSGTEACTFSAARQHGVEKLGMCQVVRAKPPLGKRRRKNARCTRGAPQAPGATLLRSRVRNLVDNWSFCLKAAMMAANRRDQEQTNRAEPQPGFQGEGGACRRQVRPDDSPIGRALRRPPHPVTAWKAQLEAWASDVFGAGSSATVAPAVDVKSLNAKSRELTLENDS